DTQTLLELHYWEGLDAPEIAVALDVRPGTVRARLMRARQQLRALMVGHDPCGDDEARLLRDLLD
ncbi:MAG: sigma-70 region 4 domain-containing protein, partial [Myxococcales bacterium]|nr:sigma-70 region 4 domain-containing protein [Myxococcales bacterium]